MFCETCDSIEFSLFEHIPTLQQHVNDPETHALEPFREAGAIYKYYLHHRNFTELLSSAKAGCWFCAALACSFLSPPPHWGVDGIDTSTILSDHPVILRIWYNHTDPQYDWQSWREIPVGECIVAFCGMSSVSMRREDPTVEPFARFSYDLQDLWTQDRLFAVDFSTGGEPDLELGRLWLEHCLEHHPDCRNIDSDGPTQTPLLPTRVIDVKEQGVNPVLHLTRPGEVGEYIALSHCWGGTEPLAVVLDGHDTGLATSVDVALPLLAQWPRSFQDAVSVCHTLHIRYLWIDNTGIRQGDALDWAIESVKMAEYFGNATLTVASASGASDDDGMFTTRNPFFYRPLPLVALGSLGQLEQDPVWVHIAGPSAAPSPPMPALHSRAWTLQEELLSRRVLTFGERYISWNCLQSWGASEPSPNMSDLAPYRYNKRSGMPAMRINMRLPDYEQTHDLTRNPYYNLWYQLVVRFSGRNMTYKKDVLPAISGLAQTFLGFVDQNDSYVAGLWRADLVLGLLWTVAKLGNGRLLMPEGSRNYITEGFQAPSWSWISRCDRRINYHFDDRIMPGGVYSYRENEEVIGSRILQVGTKPRYKDQEYGEVLGGFVRVLAKLETIRIDIQSLDRTSAEVEKSAWISGDWGSTHFRRLTMDNRHFPSVHNQIQGDCDLDDVEQKLCPASIDDGHITAFFLPLVMHSNDGDLPTRLVGLALLPAVEHEEEQSAANQANRYIRIGRAAIDIYRYQFEECTIPLKEVVIL